jgi:hypothetical protein
MTEPSENEVVAKARALAHEDGLLWDAEDHPHVTAQGVDTMLDDHLRVTYLNRAREALRGQVRMSDDGF